MKIFTKLTATILFMSNILSVHAVSRSLELTIKSSYGAGFFAELHRVVDNILHFSAENLEKVDVDWSDEFFLYKDDPYENGWDLFFEPIVFSQESDHHGEVIKTISGMNYHELHDQLCIDHWMRYDSHLPYRMQVHDTLNKYIKVKKHILDKVDHITKTLMADHYCIGAHVRYGSDHAAEEPQGHPKLEDYLIEIAKIIQMNQGKKIKIYLATDSEYVVNTFRSMFSREMVLTIDTCRTTYRDVPHLIYGNGDYWLVHKEEFHQKKPGYFGGEGVLMDCLLLSKCDVLIHTTSNVPAFATFFNPHLPSIYLPKTNNTWPCRHGR